jgi:hypothetical protein
MRAMSDNVIGAAARPAAGQHAAGFAAGQADHGNAT